MVGEGKIKCKFFFSGMSYPFDVGRFWPSQVHFQKMGEGVTWREEYTVSIESTSRGHHRWHFSKYNILRNGGGNLSRVLYYNNIVFFPLKNKSNVRDFKIR